MLVLISSGIFCCIPTILIGLSGRRGGCFAMILAVSVHNNRTSVFLLSGGFSWFWDSFGKHFPRRVLQDLMRWDSFGSGGPACQELRSLHPSLQNRLGLGLGCSPGFLICLAKCSSLNNHPLKQSSVSGCCLSLPSGLLAFYSSL